MDKNPTSTDFSKEQASYQLNQQTNQNKETSEMQENIELEETDKTNIMLQMPYHRLALFHYPESKKILDSESLEFITSLKPDVFVESPLSIYHELNYDELNFENIIRFLIFRFWIACKRFPELVDYIGNEYLSGMKIITEKLNPLFRDQMSQHIQICLLWHLSRGLLDFKTEVINRTLNAFGPLRSLKLAEGSKWVEIAQKTEKSLKSIVNTPAFQLAVQKFAEILGKQLNPEELTGIIKKLNNMKIISVSHSGSLYGMVIPNGIALISQTIEKYVKSSEKSILGKEFRELTLTSGLAGPQKNETEETLLYALWTAIHETGHFIVRTEEVSSGLRFGKMTPPSKIKEIDIEYQNLEAGFLFSSIFLGSFGAKIWQKPELMSRLLNPSDLLNIPVFTNDELKGLPRIEKLNLSDSGIFSVDTLDGGEMIL